LGIPYSTELETKRGCINAIVARKDQRIMSNLLFQLKTPGSDSLKKLNSSFEIIKKMSAKGTFPDTFKMELKRFNEFKMRWKNMKKRKKVIFIYGEKRTGKSTLINLFLGVQLLPNEDGPACTACLTYIEYGEEPQLQLFKWSSKKPSLCVDLNKSLKETYETLQKYLSCREEGKSYDYAKLFWPSPFLQLGIILVDSPGLNESRNFDFMVKQAFHNLEDVIYVHIVSLREGFGGNTFEKLDNRVLNSSYVIGTRGDQISKKEDRERASNTLINKAMSIGIKEDCILIINLQSAFIQRILGLEPSVEFKKFEGDMITLIENGFKNNFKSLLKTLKLEVIVPISKYEKHFGSSSNIPDIEKMVAKIDSEEKIQLVIHDIIETLKKKWVEYCKKKNWKSEDELEEYKIETKSFIQTYLKDTCGLESNIKLQNKVACKKDVCEYVCGVLFSLLPQYQIETLLFRDKLNFQSDSVDPLMMDQLAYDTALLKQELMDQLLQHQYRLFSLKIAKKNSEMNFLRKFKKLRKDIKKLERECDKTNLWILPNHYKSYLESTLTNGS